ncbi:MAG: hypothetical protein EZS28_012018 [Streblomastix strix]|uniref:Uncharacterized protein n=1 Tax=Streblomastix strix TaxID=222440 RepID=A0A5J4WCS0_9EUKA|nr:MAG: hypothetical protein EZS28_012018 [Streblomastix strix]
MKLDTNEQEVNVSQQTLGTTTQDIGENSANGDFAFSAESDTVWMYDADWYNSGDIVPDQVTPASDATPLVDSGTSVAGTSTKYSHGDHKHPLQVSTVSPSKDTSVGEIGTLTTYARSDHTHHINLSSNVPLKDTGTGTAGTDNVYASATHYHSLYVNPSSVNVPLVNATAEANGTSDYYSRNDHVHSQQLTYTGPLTSTMFIKNGAQATDVLLANGDSKSITVIAGDGFVVKTGKTLQAAQDVLLHRGDDEESEDDNDYITRGVIYNQYVSKASPDTIIATSYVLNAGNSTSFAGVKCGLVQIKPNGNNFNEGLRISRSSDSNYSATYLACNQKSISGSLKNQWSIINTPTGELRIGVSDQLLQDNKGLEISSDGNSLSFNGSVIAGAGEQSGASNGSINYSAGNPILQGVNSVDTNGGFYSDGPKVYWRAKPVTLGAVPP